MKDSTEVNKMIMSYIQHKRSPDLKENLGEKHSLEEILHQLRPMLMKRCRHYFGYITEDLLQSGYLELIERMETYDENRTEIPVLGYLNRMISCHYFSMKRKESKESDRLCRFEKQLLENIQADEPSNYEYFFDINDLLIVLTPIERTLIQEHILKKQSLRSVAKKMNISYSYAKKIKAKSLIKLRHRLQELALLNKKD